MTGETLRDNVQHGPLGYLTLEAGELGTDTPASVLGLRAVPGGVKSHALQAKPRGPWQPKKALKGKIINNTQMFSACFC